MSATKKEQSEEYKNENFEADFKYASEMNNWMLKPVGVWFIGTNYSVITKILRVLSIFGGSFLQLFFFVPWLIVVLRLNFYDAIRMTASMILLSSAGVKYFFLVLRDDQIRNCMHHTMEDWRDVQTDQQHDIMMHNAKFGRVITMIAVFILYSGGLAFCVLPIAASGTMNENNVTLRIHPAPNELFIIDSQVSPAYEIVYLLQSMSCYVLYSIICATIGLTAEFVNHACGQFEIIMTILGEMSEDSGKFCDTFEKKMITVVLKHLRILRFISNLESLFSEIYMTEFASASGLICLIGYYVVSDLDKEVPLLQTMVYIFVFLSTLFNVFGFCYMGEMLIHQCQKVGFACYAVGWYELPHKKTLTLMLPIAIADYPTNLSAGGVMTLSLETFSSILRASMAYFNLLRQVM